jgi:hypothetical protein
VQLGIKETDTSYFRKKCKDSCGFYKALQNRKIKIQGKTNQNRIELITSYKLAYLTG